MRPAFSSTKAAAAFALLLLLLLALPAVMGKNLLPPRGEVYSGIGWVAGDFPYMRQQIFEEAGDADIVFVGASRMLHGIDTPYVRQELSRQLGRPAVVHTLAWCWAGYDALYFITHDLLQHRKVRMIVFYDDGYDLPHRLATRWFRFRENAGDLAGLTFPMQAEYYFAAIIGMPRQLLNLVRPNRWPDEINPEVATYWELKKHALSPIQRLGTVTCVDGFSPTAGDDDHAAFTAFTPQNGVRPEAACVYSPATSNRFKFTREGFSAWENHLSWQDFFINKFAAQAKAAHCQLVLLHLPAYDERRSNVIGERTIYAGMTDPKIPMLGIPPDRLFAGLDDGQVQELYYDPYHFNLNGQTWFTRLITPPFLKLYENATNH